MLPKIVLASSSPRRQELLRQIGIPFVVQVSTFEEDNSLNLIPQELTVWQAKQKAFNVFYECLQQNHPADLIIGADTVVVLNGEVFGKPNDETEAKAMLTRLAGREHQVITGVAVVKNGKVSTDFSETQVWFRPLSQEEIEQYVATGEPLDKAGAYAIQGIGALLVEKISGSYDNVVGLPLNTLAKCCHNVGVDLWCVRKKVACRDH